MACLYVLYGWVAINVIAAYGGRYAYQLPVEKDVAKGSALLIRVPWSLLNLRGYKIGEAVIHWQKCSWGVLEDNQSQVARGCKWPFSVK